MASLHAGELNKRVTLQRQETLSGQLGEVIPGGVIDIATVWAKAEVKSNRKIRTLDQKQVVETWLFTIRPRQDVDIDWKLRWKDELFTVVAVDRSQSDRVEIKAERDGRHDRASN
jgi:SPP1 family predicted phage head-tail adaptor